MKSGTRILNEPLTSTSDLFVGGPRDISSKLRRPLSAFSFIGSTWHAVAQLVEVLLYKPQGRGFDSRWCHWNFSLTQSFRSHYGPGVDSASNRNEYQEYFLGGKGGC